MVQGFGDRNMTDKAKHARDGYAFSLGGMTSIAHAVFVPALDAHRINRAWDARLRGRWRRRTEKRNDWGRGSPRDLHGNWA